LSRPFSACSPGEDCICATRDCENSCRCGAGPDKPDKEVRIVTERFAACALSGARRTARGFKEHTMIHIKVQYDPRQRVFKLVDQEFKTLLEGDALYDLAIPLLFEEWDVDDFVSLGVAHA
jgi:hypothetical protein